MSINYIFVIMFSLLLICLSCLLVTLDRVPYAGDYFGTYYENESTCAPIDYGYFEILYDPSLQTARFSAHKVRANFTSGNIKRTDDFREDGNLTGPVPELDDYAGSGFDRGHLVPAGDFTASKEMMSRTFFMTNMIPQTPALNRGEWRLLEEWIRDVAEKYGEILVFSGPIPSENYIGDGVNVPAACWKVIVKIRPYDPPEMIGFILPNWDSDIPSWESCVVSVNQVEDATSVNILAAFPEELQEISESTVNVNYWFTKTKK